MLVLSRKNGEEILIGDDIRIVLVAIRGDKARIGIEAPRTTPVHRKEVKDAIDSEAAAARREADSRLHPGIGEDH